MRFNAQYFVFCSALTLTAACSDNAGTPIGTGGATTGGAGAGGAAAGTGGNGTAGTSAGMSPGGMAGSGAGMAGAGMGGGGAGGAGTGGMGGGGAAGMGGMGGAAPVPVCGNGKKEGTEACDDGNKTAKDGCSDTCTVEDGYDCAYEGMACKPICGDGKVIAPEKCDDKNTSSGDGCSNDCGTVENGFECKTAGAACTTICGDGVLAGAELCDDGNIKPSDGCTATCTPEAGFVCDIPGQSCRTQPDCTGGSCKSACGDGLVINEDCDDGNLIDNDGCSSMCQVEQGFTCKIVDAPPPAQLAIPVTYRDFIATAMGGSTKFPDQIAFQGQGITPGMVDTKLDNEGLPVYTGICEQGGPNENDAQKCPYGAQTTSKANFDMWYRDTDGTNLTFPGVVKLDRVGMTSAYVFDGGSTFTPLTGIGWDKLGKEALNDGRNFGFTTELRYFFMYQGDEVLDFSGDDDVWVFINGRLAVDIGGLHPKQTQSVTLGVQKSQELGLTVGKVYELALFHAERRPGSSNFKLTLTGFLNSISKCTKN